MRTWLLAGLFLSLVLITVQTVSAVSIEGNGDGSKNSIELHSSDTTSIQQHNSTSIKTTVEADAQTGGNTANGNKGNTSIKTGDATIDIKVINQVNQNTATVPCCGTPTPTKQQHTPTPTKVSATPTPTPGNGSDSPGKSSNSGSTGTNNNSGGIGGGSASPEILGLSATSGVPVTDRLFHMAGALCLGLAATLAHRRTLHG